MIHTIRSSSGYARSYFDKNRIRRQENVYRVRIRCDCGFMTEAPVDEITAVWKAHLEEGR